MFKKSEILEKSQAISHNPSTIFVFEYVISKTGSILKTLSFYRYIIYLLPTP